MLTEGEDLPQIVVSGANCVLFLLFFTVSSALEFRRDLQHLRVSDAHYLSKYHKVRYKLYAFEG
jgi:hypothetical protein